MAFPASHPFDRPATGTDLSLFPTLSVVENLFLNTYLREKSRIVDWRRGRRMAREVLGRLDVAFDLDANIETLPVAGRSSPSPVRCLPTRG
ncbi:hypothetical protein [Aquicoccus sp.]|uniref:hypothetical protein n=1 Tax=Aquicoccus sp. TaxID=2055851 RepID=UPI00356137B9